MRRDGRHLDRAPCNGEGRGARSVLSICRWPFFVTSTPRHGRPRRWCSQVCRRAAYEERRAAENGATTIEYVAKPAPEISLDAHVAAVLDSPAACRRLRAKDIRSRDVAGALDDARWSSVHDELERR